MTTNEPLGPESAEPSQPAESSPSTEPSSAPFASAAPGEPDWGTAPSTPPAGSGSDHGPSGGTPHGGPHPGPYGGPQPGWHGGPHHGGSQHVGPQVPPGAGFFERVRSFQITRPDPGQGRMIGGVAAGIARRYQVAPVVVRIVLVLLALFAGGLGVLLYGLGWLFLPHPDGRIHAQQVLAGTVTAGFVGALLTVLAAAHHALPLLLVAALVTWLVARHRRTEQAAA